MVYPSGVILSIYIWKASLSSPFPGLLHSSPDSLAESWFRAKLSRQRSYSSAHSYEESDLDLSRSLGIHALIDNMVSFISGDVGLAPAFKEPEESMSTSPQATILAMEQQQSRAEVRDCLKTSLGFLYFFTAVIPHEIIIIIEYSFTVMINPVYFDSRHQLI